MDTEPREAKPTRTTFVYDVRTGKVVHIHQFIPSQPDGTCSEREMEETALKLAPASWERSQLSVLHHDKDFDLNPEYQYRVDIKTRTLVVESAPPGPTRDRTRKKNRTQN